MTLTFRRTMEDSAAAATGAGEGPDTLAIAVRLHEIYIPTYSFPTWVLQPELWATFAFAQTVVYYEKSEDLETVQTLVREREPCNIGMQRCYFEDELERQFGYRHGAYQRSDTTTLMPNIAIYCYATVKTETGFQNVHVINLVGFGLDTMTQPDYRYLMAQDRPTEALVKKYHYMWRKAFMAALDLRKSGKIDKIKVFNVGGGAFAGRYFCTFTEDIFEPAFLPLLPFFARAGIQVIGYDPETQAFNGGFVPEILDTDEDVAHTLYVNAWDPWSMIGNGNGRDNSLDGYWGRCSNMAVLGWSVTNPWMMYRAVG